MRYYPIAVDTKDKNILVVGGGKAAYIKLKNLINTWASITVISKEFSIDIINLYKLNSEKLILEKKEINKDNIDLSHNYNLAFICTDDRELNNKLYEYFKYKKTLAMMADDRESSDFINSAVLERENITIAFNTEGRSPMTSKLLLKETEKMLTDELIEKVNLICKIREKFKKERYADLNEKALHYMMEKIILYSNQELEERLRTLNEIAGDSK